MAASRRSLAYTISSSASSSICFGFVLHLCPPGKDTKIVGGKPLYSQTSHIVFALPLSFPLSPSFHPRPIVVHHVWAYRLKHLPTTLPTSPHHLSRAGVPHARGDGATPGDLARSIVASMLALSLDAGQGYGLYYIGHCTATKGGGVSDRLANPLILSLGAQYHRTDSTAWTLILLFPRKRTPDRHTPRTPMPMSSSSMRSSTPTRSITLCSNPLSDLPARGVSQIWLDVALPLEWNEPSSSRKKETCQSRFGASSPRPFLTDRLFREKRPVEAIDKYLRARAELAPFASDASMMTFEEAWDIGLPGM